MTAQPLDSEALDALSEYVRDVPSGIELTISSHTLRALIAAARLGLAAERLHKERAGLWLRLDTITSSIQFLIVTYPNTQMSQELQVFIAPNAWGTHEWIRRDDDSGSDEPGGGDGE